MRVVEALQREVDRCRDVTRPAAWFHASGGPEPFPGVLGGRADIEQADPRSIIAALTVSRSARTRTQQSNVSEIRAWAKSNGYDISDRGRIPAAVVEAYQARYTRAQSGPVLDCESRAVLLAATSASVPLPVAVNTSRIR